MAYIKVDDVVIDEDTGELIDARDDALALVAQRLYDANQQIKEWQDYANALKASLLLNQVEKTVNYGDVVAQVRQAVRKTLDIEAFKLYLPELHHQGWVDLAMAATAFDRALLPSSVLDGYDRSITKTPNKPYVVVSLVRKPAPNVRHDTNTA